MLTVADAARACNMSKQSVSNAIFAGLISAPKKTSKGIGYPVELSDRNIRELKVVAALRSVGVQKSAIRSIMDLLMTSKWWHTEGWIVIPSTVAGKWFITDNLFSRYNRDILSLSESVIIVKI